MTSIPRLLAVAVIAAFGASLPAYGSDPRPQPPEVPTVFDRELLSCLEETPDQISPLDPQSDTPPVVNVLVLHDGVPVADARKSMAKAALPYEQAGLKFATTYRKVSLPSDGRNDGRDTGFGRGLIEQSKHVLKGARPKGIDVVYLLTSKDIYSGSPSSRNYSLAGLADCIGGVRFADRAFAVGEYGETYEAFGLQIPPSFTAAVAAHEVGHLFGAHHHYATCTRPGAPVNDGFDVCTIMFPDIGLAGLEFSVTNAAIVRGHAYKYATP